MDERPGTNETSATAHNVMNEPPIYSRSFFDKSEDLSTARAGYLKAVFGGCILIILTIFLVVSIYWGALWKTNGNVHHLTGWVVDFDGGLLGQTVMQGFGNLSGNSQLSWRNVPARNFPNGPDDLRAAVLNEECWLAIAVNPGATNSLNAAVAIADPTYNGSLAVTAYGVEARNENSFRDTLEPLVSHNLANISALFAPMFVKQVASRPNIASILLNAPQIIAQPLSYTFDNIKPFDVPVATAVTFVGLIYLTILAFMITLIGQTAREETGLNAKLGLRSLILLRVIAPIFIYFFLSLFYALLSYAFQVPFNRVYGDSGFVIFWMLCWCGMMALGLALEAMITLLTEKFVSFFLVLWIISNVSVTFLPLPYLPGIYKYGYAFPFYNISQGVRRIIFGTKNHLGLNFGVLIAWSAISIITIPFFQWLRRRSAIKASKLQQADEKN